MLLTRGCSLPSRLSKNSFSLFILTSSFKGRYFSAYSMKRSKSILVKKYTNTLPLFNVLMNLKQRSYFVSYLLLLFFHRLFEFFIFNYYICNYVFYSPSSFKIFINKAIWSYFLSFFITNSYIFSTVSIRN